MLKYVPFVEFHRLLRLTFVLGQCLAALFLPSYVFAQGTDCSLVRTAMLEASAVRGLKEKKPVACSLQEKSQVEKYLRETLNKKVPAERVESEGKVYEFLGIVPLGYDYLNSIIKLYTEQLGGYYDTDSKRYVMARWLPAAMQMPIAVHELTHALQDQHFDLEGLLDEKNDSSDSLLARSSLIEGDATAVMLDYARRMGHEPPLAKEKSVSAFMMQNITGAMLTGSVSSAPSAIQAMMIFPYVSGLRFAHRLLIEGGYEAINSAFKRPPGTTEEILHPELYFSRKKSYEEPKFPEQERLRRFRPEEAIYQDRLGEFVVSTLLAAYISPLQASNAASGWGGDRLWLFRKENGAHELVWRVLWDSEADTEEFFAAILLAYNKRFQREEKSQGTSVRFSQTGVGEIELVHSKKTVDVIFLSLH